VTAERHEALTRAARRALGTGLLTSRQLTQADEAVALVERALRAWPLRDPHGWVSEVVLLDLPRASTALARLIRTHSTPPTVAALIEAYGAVSTATPAAQSDGCRDCSGTGWVDAPPLSVRVDGVAQEVTQMRPCTRCADGAARERSSIWRERDGCGA
jgi:hypothetical protein